MRCGAESIRQPVIRHPGGRVNVDGRGGQAAEVIVPLVLFLSSQDQPEITGMVLSAKEWNEGKTASSNVS